MQFYASYGEHTERSWRLSSGTQMAQPGLRGGGKATSQPLAATLTAGTRGAVWDCLHHDPESPLLTGPKPWVAASGEPTSSPRLACPPGVAHSKLRELKAARSPH